MAYDFTDPNIVAMVQSNHRPIELPAGPAPTVTETVEPIPLVTVCVMDHEPWPCTAVTELREFQGTPGRGGGKGPLTAAEVQEKLRQRIAEGKIVA